jgi:hypothetical protein
VFVAVLVSSGLVGVMTFYFRFLWWLTATLTDLVMGAVVSELFVLGYFHFPSQWNLRGASIPFFKASRNCDFSPLRRFCVVSFGCSQRLLVVSAACLFSLRSNGVVVLRFVFGLSFHAAVGWRFFLSSCGLISECEYILLSFEGAVLFQMELK